MRSSHSSAVVRTSQPRRYAELGRLITGITRADDQSEIHLAVARHLRGIVTAERASVAIVLPDGTHVAVHALDDRGVVAQDEALPLQQLLLRRAVEQRQIIMTNPAMDSPDLDMRRSAEAGMHRGLIAPLIGRDAVHGTITVEKAADEPYSKDDHVLISQIADLVAAALERVQLVHETRDAAHAAEVYAMRLESLNEVSHELAGALTEDAVFATVADALPWIVPYDRTGYAVAQPGGDHLRIGALRGRAGRADADTLIPVRGTIAGQALTEAEAVYVADATECHQWDARMLVELGIRTVMSIPISVAGSVEATLNVAATDVDCFGVHERGILTTFARLMGSTIERVRTAERLDHRARHDDLTGLANRREFERILGETLREVATTAAHASLCYLDLDHFKTVNDSYGHGAGDKLLIDLATQLHSLLHDDDLLARWGGDEFALVLHDCPLGDAIGVAERLRRHVADATFVYEGRVLPTSLSIGVTELRPDMTLATALREADAAAYQAKTGGRNRVAVARAGDGLGTRQQHEAEAVRMIKTALREDRFELHAQPIVALAADPCDDGPVCEILVRMRDSDDQLVMPGDFIHIAERYGLIAEIDQWVIRNAMKWIAGPDAPEQGLCAVNVSGESVNSPEFLDRVLDIVRTSTAPTSRLCFEITETAAIRQAREALRFMSALSALGCRFSLDDFGSGFSSFGALKYLPVDYIKIDGDLVRDIVTSPLDKAAVQAIQTLAEALDTPAIAEFVEDDATRAILTEMGVSYGQGYGLGRPAPISERRSTDAVAPAVSAALPAETSPRS